MSYYTELNHEEQIWYRLQEINTEIIESQLRGKMTPDRSDVIRMLNTKRRDSNVGRIDNDIYFGGRSGSDRD